MITSAQRGHRADNFCRAAQRSNVDKARSAAKRRILTRILGLPHSGKSREPLRPILLLIHELVSDANRLGIWRTVSL